MVSSAIDRSCLWSSLSTAPSLPPRGTRETRTTGKGGGVEGEGEDTLFERFGQNHRRATSVLTPPVLFCLPLPA